MMCHNLEVEGRSEPATFASAGFHASAEAFPTDQKGVVESFDGLQARLTKEKTPLRCIEEQCVTLELGKNQWGENVFNESVKEVFDDIQRVLKLNLREQLSIPADIGDEEETGLSFSGHVFV